MTVVSLSAKLKPDLDAQVEDALGKAGRNAQCGSYTTAIDQLITVLGLLRSQVLETTERIRELERSP